MNVEIKDFVFLAIGTVVGFIVGIAIYWVPLGQFLNEIRAILSLLRKQYSMGDVVAVLAGTDLKPVNTQLGVSIVTVKTNMTIWHDEGVTWHHTKSGWKRARILHVFFASTAPLPDIYRICHLDLV